MTYALRLRELIMECVYVKKNTWNMYKNIWNRMPLKKRITIRRLMRGKLELIVTGSL